MPDDAEIPYFHRITPSVARRSRWRLRWRWRWRTWPGCCCRGQTTRNNRRWPRLAASGQAQTLWPRPGGGAAASRNLSPALLGLFGVVAAGGTATAFAADERPGNRPGPDPERRPGPAGNRPQDCPGCAGGVPGKRSTAWAIRVAGAGDHAYRGAPDHPAAQRPARGATAGNGLNRAGGSSFKQAAGRWKASP